MTFDVEHFNRIYVNKFRETELLSMIDDAYILLDRALLKTPLPCTDENDEPGEKYALANEFTLMGGFITDNFLRFKHIDTKCYIYFNPNTGVITWEEDRAEFAA